MSQDEDMQDYGGLLVTEEELVELMRRERDRRRQSRIWGYIGLAIVVIIVLIIMIAAYSIFTPQLMRFT